MEHRLSSGSERFLAHDGRYTYRTVVSPSGDRLAFFQGDTRKEDTDEPGWERDLLVMPLSGGSPEVVWSSEGRVHFSWDVGLNWTPDGTRLLLATYDPGSNSQQLYAFNPDTHEKVKIGEPLVGDDQATHMRNVPCFRLGPKNTGGLRQR